MSIVKSHWVYQEYTFKYTETAEFSYNHHTWPENIVGQRNKRALIFNLVNKAPAPERLDFSCLLSLEGFKFTYLSFHANNVMLLCPFITTFLYQCTYYTPFTGTGRKMKTLATIAKQGEDSPTLEHNGPAHIFYVKA